DADSDRGRFDILLEHFARAEQSYERNTAILSTRLFDTQGGGVEIVDFAPRYHQYGRTFAPVMVVRIVRRLAGRPRIRVRFAPRCNYGAETPAIAFGSHHVRAQVPAYPLRLTTDAPVTHVTEERPLLVERELVFLLGPDETLQGNPHEIARHMHEETQRYWRR